MPALPLHLLPASMQELAEAIGLMDTLTLIELRGGRRVCVPVSTDNKDCFLYGKLSDQGYQKLVQTYAGETLEIRSAALAITKLRHQLIKQAYAEGKGTAQIAEEFKMSERNVRYIRQQLDAQTQQTSLF